MSPLDTLGCRDIKLRNPDLVCLFSGDPDRYMHCIEFLLSCLCKNLNDQLDGPLVINTMGWIRALGLQLLVDTIRIVSIYISIYHNIFLLTFMRSLIRIC